MFYKKLGLTTGLGLEFGNHAGMVQTFEDTRSIGSLALFFAVVCVMSNNTTK